MPDITVTLPEPPPGMEWRRATGAKSLHDAVPVYFEQVAKPSEYIMVKMLRADASNLINFEGTRAPDSTVVAIVMAVRAALGEAAPAPTEARCPCPGPVDCPGPANGCYCTCHVRAASGPAETAAEDAGLHAGAGGVVTLRPQEAHEYVDHHDFCLDCDRPQSDPCHVAPSVAATPSQAASEPPAENVAKPNDIKLKDFIGVAPGITSGQTATEPPKRGPKPLVLTDHLRDGDRCGWHKVNGEDRWCSLKHRNPAGFESTVARDHAWFSEVPPRPEAPIVTGHP